MYFYTTDPDFPREQLPSYFFDEAGAYIYPETYTEEEVANFSKDYVPNTDFRFNWLTTIKSNLQAIFRNRTDVYVTADLYWYLKKDKPALRVAPDIMVVFDRPNQSRKTYLQWEEENIAPQVIFQLGLPFHSKQQLQAWLHLYEQNQVQECYIYNEPNGQFYAFQRNIKNNRLELILPLPYVNSPLLGIQMEILNNKLQIYRPNGVKFLTFEEQFEIYEQLTTQKSTK